MSKKCLLLISMFLFLLPNVSFSYHPKLNDNTDRINQEIAYTIDIQGKAIDIKRVPQKDYLSNAIHIKTKTFHNISKDNKAIYSSVIQSSIDDLGITNIRAPFEKYASGELQSVDKFGVSRIYEIYYDAPIDPYDVCRELIKNPEIEYAVPIFKAYQHDFKPDDTRYLSQWHLKRIGMEQAWDITKGDKEIIIGMVDSGVDWDHEDLAGNIWTNPIDTIDGIDNDGNGKIDDVRGWDLIGNVTIAQAQSGQWKENNDPRNNANYHGTHTAGCASAVTNNDLGIASPGFNCTILPVQCGSENAQAGGGIYRGYEGIMYAAEVGAHIINCSWGGPGYSPAAQDIINQVTALGSLIVVSAGNDGTNNDIYPTYPASYDNVLSVGASNSNDRAASNYGITVTVFGPGINIMSTMPNNQYRSQSGTSMSAPVTSGVAALIRHLHPDWTPKQIIHQIRSTSDNVLAASNPTSRPSLYGRINGFNAVNYNLDGESPNIPGVEVTDFSFASGTGITDLEISDVNMEITNYIGRTENLTITISPIDNFIEVLDDNIDVGSLEALESTNINAQIRLLKNTPWFFGDARLLVTFTDGDYVDYQLIKVPIRLTTNNSFTKLNVFLNSAIFPQWHNSHAPSKDVFWAVGGSPAYRTGIFFLHTPYQNIFNNNINDTLFAIYAFDENTAFAGSGLSQNTSVYKTTNGGQNWSPKSVSHITGFINEIYFYDDKNGIFLGDPVGTSLTGIGYTSDGGDSWQMVTDVPSWYQEETGYVGCRSYLKDHIWFGTSKGRVYRSSDRGQSWQASGLNPGGHVVYLAFKSPQEGIAVYTETADLQNSPRLAAYTSDGGETWTTGTFSFTDNNLRPVHIFAPARSDLIAVMYSGGEVFATEGDGSEWFPILTTQHLGAVEGAEFIEDYSGRLYNVSLNGTNMSYLDFDLTGYVSVEDRVVSNGIILEQNAPNPCKDITRVSYTLPEADYVVLNIYNSNGVLISEIFEGHQASGKFEKEVNVENLSSGMYYFGLQVGKRNLIMKFLIIR